MLHGVLRAALPQLNENGHASLAEARRLAGSRTFQDALLNCAIELVAYAASGEPTFPELTSRMGRLPLVLDLWDAVAHFGKHMCCTSPAICVYLGYMRVRITEDLAWRNGSSLFQAMHSGGGGSCAAGDKALVSVRACCHLFVCMLAKSTHNMFIPCRSWCW